MNKFTNKIAGKFKIFLRKLDTFLNICQMNFALGVSFVLVCIFRVL